MATGTILCERSVLILNFASGVPTTATSYPCNWQNYSFLLVCATFYGNIQSTIMVSKAYFSTTTSSGRIQLLNNTSGANGLSYDIYQNGSGNVYLKATDTLSNYGLRIYGIN